MALGFFRRRQKVVLAFMALLMVLFLVPSIFQRLDGEGERDATIGYTGEKKVTVRTIRAAEVDLHLLGRSLRLGTGMGRRTGEVAFAVFGMINRDRDAGLTWALLLREAGQMGITVTQNQVDVFLAESGLTDEAYRHELTSLRENHYTEKHLRQAVADYLLVMTAFEAAEVNTPPSLPELRQAFGDLRERIALAMVSLPAEDFAAGAPEPTEEAVFDQFNRHRHLAAQGQDNKTDFGFGYRLPNRLDIAWLFIDEGPIARAVEPAEQQLMDYWNKHKGDLKQRIPVPTTSTAPTDTQPTQPVEENFREVAFESFSQARPAIREIFMPGAIDAKMSGVASLARQTIQRFADTDKPYSAAAGAMIHPADALLGRKIASLPFAEASMEAIVKELEDLAKVKIVYPFGEHDKLTLDGKVKIKVEAWGDITLGEALERIGRKAKFPPIKWVTCDGMDGALFASEPINLVPISSGQTGLVGFAEIYRHELLGRAGLKSEAGPGAGGQSLLAIAATAEVFQPSDRRHEPLIKPGSDFDRATYVLEPRRGRLLWRLVQAEADHAPLHLDQEIRQQVVKDLKTVFGFGQALAAAEAMKTELAKPGADLKKLADDKKLDFSETDLFSRKTLDIQSGQILLSHVPDIGQDEQFIASAFALVPADPDEPGDEKPAAVIPLRRQGKVMLVRRIGYEPVTEADFAGLVAGITLVETPRQDESGKISMGYGIRNATLDEVLVRWRRDRERTALAWWFSNPAADMGASSNRWERTAVTWFANQNVVKRINYRPEHPSE